MMVFIQKLITSQGPFWKYAQTVGSALKKAHATNRQVWAGQETHMYADI